MIKIKENSLSESVNLFKGLDLSHGKKLVRVIGSFEKSRVREIGDEIIEFE